MISDHTKLQEIYPDWQTIFMKENGGGWFDGMDGAYMGDRGLMLWPRFRVPGHGLDVIQQSMNCIFYCFYPSI